jgi:hypothetical protein
MILRNTSPLPRDAIELVISNAVGKASDTQRAGAQLADVAVWVRPLYMSGSSLTVFHPVPPSLSQFPSAKAARYLVSIGLNVGLDEVWWRVALEKHVLQALKDIEKLRLREGEKA